MLSRWGPPSSPSAPPPTSHWASTTLELLSKGLQRVNPTQGSRVGGEHGLTLGPLPPCFSSRPGQPSLVPQNAQDPRRASC